MKILSKIYKLLFYIFIGYPLYALSFLFPRKKGRWVFGSGKTFSDNTKYLFLDVTENHPEIEAIWLSEDKDLINSLKNKGLNAYYIYGFKGIVSLLTANIYIISYISNKHLPIWFIGKAKLINLWHGVGIKNIYFGSKKEPLHSSLHHLIKKIIYKVFRLELYRKPDIFISTSPFMSLHFQKCLNLKKNQILECDYPRNTLLKSPIKALSEYIENYNDPESINLLKKIQRYNHIYIYMPTWRPTNPIFLEKKIIDFFELNKVMQQKNSLLIFKLHPETPRAGLKNIKNNSNLILLDNSIDIYPILPFTDCLITDYSSIYYDYMLLKNKSVIFFLFDYEDYINNDQDLIMDFDQATEGAKAYSFNELIEILKMDLPLPINKAKKEQIMKLFWGKQSDKKNIIKEIQKLDK